jgi:NAD(P)-dependent dehydrogenase (short-subunit alcohol dehydrogenase family)
MDHDHDWENETVLITGASRGLGAALARAFAEVGAAIALAARGRAALNALAAELRSSGARCHAAAIDVRDETAVEEWVREAAAELGPPTVLINNASLLGPRAPLLDIAPDEWRGTLDVNLTGAFLACRSVIPIMLAHGGGSVVNVSSGAAVPPRTNWGAYAVSKHALEGFTSNLAAELAGTGVRVNSVDPGAMRTAMRGAAYPDEDPASVKTPAEAVGVFLWLGSTASRGVTGERFRADGWVPPAQHRGAPS